MAVRFSLLLFPIAAACLNAAEPDPLREQIEKDLVLKLELTSKPVIDAGGLVEGKLEIQNQSRELSHAVVRPGDGSSDGRRGPHVYYTATIRTDDGKSKPLEKLMVGRCGNFDMHWQNDVVDLKPAASLALEDWVPQPEHTFAFQEAGIVTLIAHYDYGTGFRRRGTIPPSLQGVPAFTLSSSPVEIRVERPLDVVVTPRNLPKLGGKFKIGEVVEIKLVNRSGKDISWNLSDGKAELAITVLVGKGGLNLRPRASGRAALDSGKLELKAGEELVVAGKRGTLPGLEEELELSSTGSLDRLQIGIGAGTRPVILSKPIAFDLSNKKPR